MTHVELTPKDDDRPISRAEALEAERAHLRGAGAQETAGYSALCLSGGGIRSASFALGVIQALAQRRLLEGFDYLSTVSGGGFAGGWLSAWLHHSARDGDRELVFRQLRGTALDPGRTEPAPVSRMRSYSRYMSPQLGALSADSWTLAATMLRNSFLNWMVLLPLIAAGLLLPRVYLEAVQYFDSPLQPGTTLSLADADAIVSIARISPAATFFLLASVILLMTGLAFMVIDLPSYGNRQGTQASFLKYCLAPIILGMVCLTLFWPPNVVPVSLAFSVTLATVCGVATWVAFGLIAGKRKWRPRTWMAAALSTPIVGAGMWWLTSEPFADGVRLGALYSTVALPMTLGFMSLMSMVFVALASADQSEGDLEWHARYNAWLFITIVVWLGVTLLVFDAPGAFRSARNFLVARLAIQSHQANGILGGVASLLGAAIGYLVRQPDTSSATTTTSGVLRKVALMLAAPVFGAFMLGGMAWGNVVAVNRLYSWGVLKGFRTTPAGRGVDDATIAEVLVVATVLLAVGWIMARFIPVNKFSLHGMYRERLVRAFLGASRPAGERRPNPFTGFDPADNLPMQALTNMGRPLHVVNTTLNRVAEQGLAMQFRKAESFSITPLHAGSATLDAYRPADRYADERVGRNRACHGITLGTALSISGAAASPNMGAKSSPALTFLMTVFNARLGVWLGNPGPSGESTWRRSEPSLGIGPLMRELFGRTTDRNPYIYLSDGGHFENLGLWEMVMRRCRWILVSDAGCDPNYTFTDLATAVRTIRIDHGVPIVFDNGIDIGAERMGRDNRPFAVGRIQYSAVDGPLAEDGILIYVKATLSGCEPVDVTNYAKDCPAFPHESTADQWFTEAQFESYRMLGYSSVMQIAKGHPADGNLPAFFKGAAQHGYTAASIGAPSPV